MHGMEDAEFINAQQAIQIYRFKNITETWNKTNASVSTDLYSLFCAVMMGR
jgi:hypothetical protein